MNVNEADRYEADRWFARLAEVVAYAMRSLPPAELRDRQHEAKGRPPVAARRGEAIEVCWPPGALLLSIPAAELDGTRPLPVAEYIAGDQISDSVPPDWT